MNGQISIPPASIVNRHLKQPRTPKSIDVSGDRFSTTKSKVYIDELRRQVLLAFSQRVDHTITQLVSSTSDNTSPTSYIRIELPKIERDGQEKTWKSIRRDLAEASGDENALEKLLLTDLPEDYYVVYPQLAEPVKSTNTNVVTPHTPNKRPEKASVGSKNLSIVLLFTNSNSLEAWKKNPLTLKNGKQNAIVYRGAKKVEDGDSP